MGKRSIYGFRRFHLSWGKARRMNRIYDTIDREREAIIGLVVDTTPAEGSISNKQFKEVSESEKLVEK